MSEERGTYRTNEADALMQTAQVIARSGNRDIILDLRRSFLAALVTLERAAGISPTTVEMREFWCQAHRSNNARKSGQ